MPLTINVTYVERSENKLSYILLYLLGHEMCVHNVTIIINPEIFVVKNFKTPPRL